MAKIMTDSEKLKLENQLCFALYSTSLAMTQLYKDLLSDLGLTYPQYTIMLILWEKDRLSLKDICQRLGQKPGAITPVVKRLEADGLVLRVRGLEDDRSLSIQLSAKGKKMKTKALNVNRCVAEACQLNEKEFLSLRNGLFELRDRLIK